MSTLLSLYSYAFLAPYSLSVYQKLGSRGHCSLGFWKDGALGHFPQTPGKATGDERWSQMVVEPMSR